MRILSLSPTTCFFSFPPPSSDLYFTFTLLWTQSVPPAHNPSPPPQPPQWLLPHEHSFRALSKPLPDRHIQSQPFAAISQPSTPLQPGRPPSLSEEPSMLASNRHRPPRRREVVERC